MKLISFVIPVWNEEGSLEELHALLKKIVKTSLVKYSVEMIFVDDGSIDKSSSILKGLKRDDKRVKILVFRVHVGKSTALNQGFKVARGEIVVTLDSDLQDRPENVPGMIEELEKGYDMVVGWKKDRRDPLEKKVMSRIFNWWLRLVSGVKLHDIDCGLKVFRKKVVEEVELYGQQHRFFPILAFKRGFKLSEVPVKHIERKFGKSKYGFTRLFIGLMDFTTVYFLSNFSDRPLHLFGFFGIIVTGIGILLGSYLSFLHFQGQKIGDRPLLALSVLLVIAGVQFVSTGLMAELFINLKSKKTNPPVDYLA